VAVTDVLFTAWNRLAFTQASFEQLSANTNWGLVGTLYVHDDHSTDGTAEWLEGAIAAVPAETVFSSQRRDGPVAAMNWYLDQVWPADGTFVKIDNDYVVCPGWLDDLTAAASANLNVEAIGFAPQFGPPLPASAHRDVEPSRFIGGIGLIRHRIFEACRPVSGGRHGWGAFQHRHPHLATGWLRPDLPTFELDRLPFEPWLSLSVEYGARGWQRTWDTYLPNPDDYWAWWLRTLEEAA
jgi:glycosyltransferase involved in cell wall biosynthesis